MAHLSLSFPISLTDLWLCRLKGDQGPSFWPTQSGSPPCPALGGDYSGPTWLV